MNDVAQTALTNFLKEKNVFICVQKLNCKLALGLFFWSK